MDERVKEEDERIIVDYPSKTILELTRTNQQEQRERDQAEVGREKEEAADDDAIAEEDGEYTESLCDEEEEEEEQEEDAEEIVVD